MDDLEGEICEDCGQPEAFYRCVSCGKRLCEDCACWDVEGECFCEVCLDEEG